MLLYHPVHKKQPPHIDEYHNKINNPRFLVGKIVKKYEEHCQKLKTDINGVINSCKNEEIHCLFRF